jgi:hypothetical protein
MSNDVAALDLLPAEDNGKARVTCYPSCDLTTYGVSMNCVVVADPLE